MPVLIILGILVLWAVVGLVNKISEAYNSSLPKMTKEDFKEYVRLTIGKSDAEAKRIEREIKLRRKEIEKQNKTD